MPSLRARLFIAFLRHRHLLEGRLRRTTSIDEATSIPKLRAEVERGAARFGKLPKGVRIEAEPVGAMGAEWIVGPGMTRERVLLYFHGGGLVLGSARSHRGIVVKFAQSAGITAFVFDYALAPERPYPAALEDAVAAYTHLLARGLAPQHIAFMGDSGGGNLCLATLLALRERGLPLPAGAVTLSAWTDLSNSGDSWSSNAERDRLCWRDAQTVFARLYADEHDVRDPLISPLFGELAGLPPLLLVAGGDETLRDDSTRFAERARAAGVDVSLRIGEGLFHCYPACTPMFPEAVEAHAEITAFLRRVLGMVRE